MFVNLCGVGPNLDFYLRFPPASAADSHGGQLPHLPVTHIALVNLKQCRRSGSGSISRRYGSGSLFFLINVWSGLK